MTDVFDRPDWSPYDIWNIPLVDDHCEDCETWSTGLQAWWSDPNTVQGQRQLQAIMEHYAVDDTEPIDVATYTDWSAYQ